MNDENMNVLAFAHRGSSIDCPENTMPAFEKAVELGTDFIETDIHFTRDKKFVLIHDDALERVTDGSGKVTDYTIDELKEFDAGYNFTTDKGISFPFRGKGITLCALDEVLKTFPLCRFNIDIKNKNPEQIDYFIDIVSKYNAQERIIVASKYLSILRAVRKINPAIATSFSVLETLGILFLYKSGLLFLKSSFKGISLQVPEKYGNFIIVTKRFVKDIHEKDLQVHVWTVDNEDDMKRLIDYGVDGLMSNNPALLLKVLGR
jgi:glycerophosphoryl diester phosphodiesterase